VDLVEPVDMKEGKVESDSKTTVVNQPEFDVVSGGQKYGLIQYVIIGSIIVVILRWMIRKFSLQNGAEKSAIS